MEMCIPLWMRLKYAFAIINVPSRLVKVYTNITYKGLRPI